MANPINFPTTTTTTKPCNPSYISVTLKKDQTFILPPGGKIVTVSNKNNVQSDCVDIASLEELKCYEFSILAADQCGTKSKPFTNDTDSDYKIEGILIGDVFYDVPDINLNDADLGIFPLNELISYIENPAYRLNGILTNLCWGWVADDNANQGTSSVLTFKTLPSLAKNMYIKLYTNVPDGGGAGNVYVKAQPFGTAAATFGDPREGSYNCQCS